MVYRVNQEHKKQALLQKLMNRGYRFALIHHGQIKYLCQYRPQALTHAKLMGYRGANVIKVNEMLLEFL